MLLANGRRGGGGVTLSEREGEGMGRVTKWIKRVKRGEKRRVLGVRGKG